WAPGARSFAFVGYCSFHAGTCRVSAAALMASAPEGDCPRRLGVGIHHRVCGDDAYYRPPRQNSRLLVDYRRQRTSKCCLWDSVGWCAEVRRQEGLNPLRTDGGRILADCLLNRVHLCPGGSPSVGDGSNWHCLHSTRSLRTVARTW